MTFVLAQWLATVIAAIALAHVYWALGGKWAVVAVVPQVPVEGGARLQPAFKPRGWMTMLVAAALLTIALLVCLRVGWWLPQVDHRGVAVGDQRHCAIAVCPGHWRLGAGGVFKEVKGSRFARLDTWVYSPLCVVLGAGLLAVAWV